MTKNPADLLLDQHLDYLKLPYLKENCQPLATEGATNHWSHLDYLGRLIQGEVATRQDRIIARRIKAARFPVIKTLEAFRLSALYLFRPLPDSRASIVTTFRTSAHPH
jgi:DNA replication protein DnaC